MTILQKSHNRRCASARRPPRLSGLSPDFRQGRPEIAQSGFRPRARFCLGGEFVELARSVYKPNGRRAAIKRQIDLALASELIGEKSYGRARPA